VVARGAGAPVAYKLVPKVAPTLLAQPSALLRKRGQFATKNLWVTPYRDDEKFPAGDYTIQSSGGKGLPEWTAQVGCPFLLCVLAQFNPSLATSARLFLAKPCLLHLGKACAPELISSKATDMR
jgi:Copper amine oxidase, enzyme domain